MRPLLLSCVLLGLAPSGLHADPAPLGPAPGAGAASAAPAIQGCVLALNEVTLQVKCLRNDCGQPCTKIVTDIPGTNLQEIRCDSCPGANASCASTVILDTAGQQATLQCDTVLCPQGARCQIQTVDGWSFCGCQ